LWLTFFEDFVEESNSFRLIRNPVEAREGGDQGEWGGGVVGAEFLNKIKGQCYEILRIKFQYAIALGWSGFQWKMGRRSGWNKIPEQIKETL
jgi:hypothetical protein